MNKKLSVFLFKTNDSGKDRYVEYLHSQIDLIQNVHQINLLNIELINTDKLVEQLKILLNSNNNKSLILTSKQTVEAIDNALSGIDTIDRDSILKVYCVGAATADKFNNLINKYEKLNKIKFELKQTTSNNDQQHTQNAKELAKLIINDFNNEIEHDTDNEIHLFYPCSSIRKDEIANELTQAKIKFTELFVYKTTHSPEGINQFNNLISIYSSEQNICLVFFSPSGVDAFFSNINLTLVNHFKIISIGPSTTKSLLKLNLNLNSIELKSPTPQSLLDVLKSI